MNAAPILHGVIYQQSPTVVSGMEVMDSFSGQSLPVSNMEQAQIPRTFT